ncbi:MAG: SPOR domain-containing protein, partial [Caulobacteraceae bacterium]
AAPQPATPASRPAPATPAPTAAKPTPETPAPAAAKPKPAPAAAGGSAVVQIGAFSNAAQADKGWSDAARAVPGAMAGKGKRTEPVDVGGKTFIRTYVTGFASRADAQKFCKELTAAGKSCLLR